MDNPEVIKQVLKDLSYSLSQAASRLKPEYNKMISILESDEDTKKDFSGQKIRDMVREGDIDSIFKKLEELKKVKEKNQKDADKDKNKEPGNTKGASK